MLASTARLVAAVQGLQGPGSRPVPLRAAHGPDRPTAVVRLTLRAGTTLTRRREFRAAATTWLRRAREFLFLACASRGWLGSIRRPEVTCAADKARRHRRRCEGCDEALGAAKCGGLVRTLDRRIQEYPLKVFFKTRWPDIGADIGPILFLRADIGADVGRPLR